MTALRAEWGETLDKLAKIAGRFSARERMRAKRELDELDDDDEPAPRPQLVPSTPPAPTGPYPFDPRDKASIRAYVNGGRSHG